MSDGRSGGPAAEERFAALERAVDFLSEAKQGTVGVNSEVTDVLTKQAAALECAYGVRIELLPIEGDGYSLGFEDVDPVVGLSGEQAAAVLQIIARSAERTRGTNAEGP